MKEARKKYLADLTCRWVTEPSTDTKRLLIIATLLDTRYKHYDLRSEARWRLAQTALRSEWQYWKGAQNESTNLSNQGNQPKRPRDFLDDCDDDVGQAPAKTDELDLCLSLVQGRKDICVLAWWRSFRLSSPRLVEMARRFLATPTSLAAVERLLGRAGLTYSDFSGAMTEDTLAQRLLAVSNYSLALCIGGVWERDYLYTEMYTVFTSR